MSSVGFRRAFHSRLKTKSRWVQQHHAARLFGISPGSATSHQVFPLQPRNRIAPIPVKALGRRGAIGIFVFTRRSESIQRILVALKLTQLARSG